MKMLGVLALILVVLIVFIALMIVIYKNYNSKLLSNKEKIEDAKNEFNEMYKEKYELVKKFITQIENKYKIESKTFEEVRDISVEGLFDLKSEKLLNKCYKELLQIKEDNQKTKELKIFRELIDKYEDNELHVISLRTFYNKYAVKYNNVIKKFPYSIIAKFNKYETATLLEGKEIDSDFINDMEV
jgi:hypothetical protein